MIEVFCPASIVLQVGGADLVSLLSSTGVFARIVLLVLLVFSVVSWAVIISKGLLLRKVSQDSRVFWRVFRRGGSLGDIRNACKAISLNPLVQVFESGLSSMETSDFKLEREKATPPEQHSALKQVLARASAHQIRLHENRLIFLATTASVTPFIGLFGTVWGVIGAFAGLANQDVATLRAVAPGIAEALIATAFGLFAAIPAVLAYNHFVGAIRRLRSDLDDLSDEFLTLTESKNDHS